MTGYAQSADFGTISASAFGDFRSAYYSRGKIVNKDPILPLFGNGTCSLGPLGYLGGFVWAVNAVSSSGQGADRCNAFHEVDLKPFYGYDWTLCDGWTLSSTVARQWVLLPGYRSDPPTVNEWHFGQRLSNPYVTPFYLMRHAFKNHNWTYWRLGLTHAFDLKYGFVLKPSVWGDFGDARHFESQFGSSSSDGLMAINGELRLEWWYNPHFSMYATLQEFGTVSSDARDALRENTAPQSVTELTIFSVGVAARF